MSSNVSRRNFMKASGGMVVMAGLSACGGGGNNQQSNNANTNSSDSNAKTIDLASLTGADLENAKSEIRRAIGLLFDRTYICEEIGQANQLPAATFVSQGMTEPDGSDFSENANDGKGYFDASQDALESNFNEALDVLKKYYAFDDDQGAFTNFPAITYLYNTNEGHKAIAEYLQSALAQVGITMSLENQEWATFLNTRKAGNFTIARNGWLADYTDPICFLDMWTSGSGNNDVQFGKGDHAKVKAYSLDLTEFGVDDKVTDGTWAETYDVLIDTINKTTNPEDRFAMMHIAEDMIMASGCISPLYYYTDPYMLQSDVTGFYSNPLGFKYFQKTKVGGKDDNINVCIASEPDTLDPALNSAVDGATMLVHLFSGLAKWEEDGKGGLQIAPDCATELVEGVENSDGTVTYTYTLKDGLTWSDGKPLVAGDFEFAWKRAASEELGADYGEMFSVIDGYEKGELNVKATDDKTLEVTTSNFIAYWNELLAFPVFFPTREDVVANESWAADAATYVCNGAYKMASWEHNSVITLAKRDDFHDAADVTMKQVSFYLSDDSNNMLSNFETGAWQLIDDIPTNEMARVKEEYPDEYVVGVNAGTYYVCWNINADLTPSA